MSRTLFLHQASANLAFKLQEWEISSDAELANLVSGEEEAREFGLAEVLIPELLRLQAAASIAFQQGIERASLPATNKRQRKTPIVAIGARPKQRAIPPAALRSRQFCVRRPQVVVHQDPLSADGPRTASLNIMFDVVLATGSRNLCFEPNSLEDPLAARPLFEKRLHIVETDRLRQHVAVFRRWIRFQESNAPAEAVYWAPSALLLGQFLQHVSKGGPTAAVSVYASLKWWHDKLGLPLPIQDALVQPWGQAEKQHVARQRTPLEPAIFVSMCKFLKSARGTVKSFIAWTLLTLSACLRFAHIQRSGHLRLEGWLLVGFCAKGKRRMAGTRPPFVWATPACVAPDADLASVLLLEYAELEKSLGSVPTFVVPDLRLAPGGALEASTQKVARKMPLPKFVTLLRSLLGALGVPEDQLAQASTYSLRRFMPTLADCAQADYSQRLAVGNWVEAVQDRRQQPASSMPVRYSDQKALTAGTVKLQLLAHLHHVVSLQGERLQWEHIASSHASADEVHKLASQPCWSPKVRSAGSQTSSCQAAAEPVNADVQDSSSASSEATDSEDEALAPSMGWFAQGSKGRAHLIQAQEGPRFVPWCRDSSFEVVHMHRGFGSLPDAFELCQKCASRAPLQVMRSLQNTED